ncbi:hypothetical protein [Haloarchaeobius sp. DFWS5]|uniref:hypothetical protein n=1 Tax=Haloarchaeobius sp. DFWS5 TaxID=3446114 RepID=UPI003EBAEA8C
MTTKLKDALSGGIFLVGAVAASLLKFVEPAEYPGDVFVAIFFITGLLLLFVFPQLGENTSD